MAAPSFAARGSRTKNASNCGWLFSPALLTSDAALRTPGHRSSIASISPSSIRCPKILTWVSLRPRNSRRPSA
ncbi:hypothetical protein AWB67_07569 [Caballeronia terrestris]|uniref:Uncharacterized protein n=1 Tax=Caballeronia terrestris TaxID=1226301 RepID=A0A158L4L9_9BURK|nr:hypothetical protein AWB67_07569 [Caballeronia terrestris]